MDAKPVQISSNAKAAKHGVVSIFTFKRIRRGAIILGVVFGIAVASQTIGLVKTYPSVAARGGLIQSLKSNVSLQVLFGPSNHLTNSISSYASWRVLGVVTIIGSIWGLLTATKILRGEEDAGRWETMLAGPLTAARATLQAIGGVYGGLLVAFVIAALFLIVSGKSPGVGISPTGAIVYTLTMVMGAGLFIAIGALTSQLAASRQQAALLGMAFFGVCFMVRAASTTASSLSWLHYVNPLSWIDNIQPLTDRRFIWFLPIIGLAALATGAALRLASKRDLGESRIKQVDSARPRLALLKHPLGFSFRLTRVPLASWLMAIVIPSTIFGLLATTAGNIFNESGSLTQFIGKVTRQQAEVAGTKTFLGLIFFILAILIMTIAASAVNAIRTEEAEDRLDNLLVRPVRRLQWLRGRILIVIGAILVAGLLAGSVSWLAAASQHSSIAYKDTLTAGLNDLAPAFLIMGFGILTFGIKPRLTSAVMFGLIGWGFLLEILGPLLQLNNFILDTSILHHMSAAPAVAPNWQSAGVMTGLGLLLTLVGMAAFKRRDLQNE